ncbi:DUF58 domain-containing protein [Homoserinibacter sp. YIM 151385]|uniref:DUF58 domain-containing protein n=1 Tax=Homoserinibacter sp. YIM 151385 TaxID=2985506 RepID=UPI0022EFE33A|nr:DUF58 domain-containing protein [Homoserinibacter sp. YIM 151385]WBU39200.1 DUF58 domain-containing protein [Homoserinibacter sp. YIM 151385]
MPERAPGRRLHRTAVLRPTLRGGALLVIGALTIIGGYLTGFEELVIAGCLPVVLALAALLSVRLRRPVLEVTRAFDPPVVAAGRLARVHLAFRNRAASPTTEATWNDILPWPESADPHRLPEMQPRGAGARPDARVSALAVAGYDLHPPRRGRFEIGPLALEHDDPFGLARSVLTLGGVDELVVVPDLVDLPGGSLSVAQGEGASLVVHRRVFGSDDDLTTREYRPGDAMRRVHWRASARHGELMVRQEEQRSHPESRVLVDTRLDGYDDLEDEPAYLDRPGVQSESFEWAVRMLASLGVHLADAGFEVVVAESAEAQAAPIGERADGARRDVDFLRSLADIRLLRAEPQARPAPLDPGSGGPVFALLADPRDAVLEWMARQRRAGDAAVAFAVGWGDERSRHALEAERRLQDAGWLVIRVDVDDDPADAWRAAHSGWGTIRGAG